MKKENTKNAEKAETTAESIAETALESVTGEAETEETVTAEVTGTAKEPGFDAFVDTLPIMGKGMLGIFLVTGIIIGVIYLLGLVKKGDK